MDISQSSSFAIKEAGLKGSHIHSKRPLPDDTEDIEDDRDLSPKNKKKKKRNKEKEEDEKEDEKEDSSSFDKKKKKKKKHHKRKYQDDDDDVDEEPTTFLPKSSSSFIEKPQRKVEHHKERVVSTGVFDDRSRLSQIAESTRCDSIKEEQRSKMIYGNKYCY